MMYVCLSVFFLWSIYPSAWLTYYMSVCLSFFYYQSAPLTGWLTLCLTEDQSLNVLTKKSEPVLVSPLFRSMFVNTGWSRRRVWGVGGELGRFRCQATLRIWEGGFFEGLLSGQMSVRSGQRRRDVMALIKRCVCVYGFSQAFMKKEHLPPSDRCPGSMGPHTLF